MKDYNFLKNDGNIFSNEDEIKPEIKKVIENKTDDELAIAVNSISLGMNLLYNELKTMSEEDKMSLSIVLGSDSIRFNKLTRYCRELGNDIITTMNIVILDDCESRVKRKFETTNEEEKHSRIIKIKKYNNKLRLHRISRHIKIALLNTQHIIKRLKQIIDGGYTKKNILNLTIGLLLVGGAIISYIFLAGGDAWLSVLEVASGGSGVTLMTRGLHMMYGSYKTQKTIEHLKPIINQLIELFDSILNQLNESDVNLSHFIPQYDKDIVNERSLQLLNSGEHLVRIASKIPLIQNEKDFWDKWLSRKVDLYKTLDEIS